MLLYIRMPRFVLVAADDFWTINNDQIKAACRAFNRGWAPEETVSYASHKTILITNATVWTGDGSKARKLDIVIENGRIAQIAANITPQSDWEIVNAQGGFVTPGIPKLQSYFSALTLTFFPLFVLPGLVDMHRHVCRNS